MAPSQDTHLENVINEVLKSGDVQALDEFLQWDIHKGTLIKCSQQFLTKLDKLVQRSLDTKDSKSASLGFVILSKCGKNLKLPGDDQGLSGIIAQGLLKKWFEKCRQLWIQCGPQWDETLFNLSEDFFDALMGVHESCKEGTYKITESFLYPVGQLVVDPRIYILIQKEAIRKFNLILDKIPAEFKKKTKILTSREASDIMIKLAGKILEGGDYDLQSGLMEALCRMATPGQRKELADRWFPMEHVATAFTKIRDSEFETDCRKFLNLVNGMQGDRRRVYSYPCLEVYLDKYELLMPADEKLQEFWIDFNVCSHSISFYFSLPGEVQEGQWETICINENEVQSYSVAEEGKRHVLQLKLSEVVVVGVVEGSSLTIHFSSSLDILQAARTVYGHSKNKGFVGKTGTSVVKTTVKILMEENSSQVVPESQVSLGENEKNNAPYLLPAPSAPIQMVTPAKMRISESTTFISSSGGGSVHDASSLSAVLLSNTPARGKGKPSLEMIPSCESKSEFYLGELGMTAKACSHVTTSNNTIASGMKEQSDTSLHSTASKQANKKKAQIMYETISPNHSSKQDFSSSSQENQNIPLAKAVEMVQTRQGEARQSLEDCFVPDTQRRTGRNISSYWSKLSVSEMLVMPTQKINSLPKPESCSILSQQREQQSSAQSLSVPVHGTVSQKQLHTKLTQRLQQVVSGRRQDPACQESVAPQRKMSDIKGDSKDRSAADGCASKLCATNKQQARRNGPSKGKSKGQMPLEAGTTLIKAPAKTSTTKALQEKVLPKVMAETNRALSSKKRRDAEVAESMVKLISSRYEMNTQTTTTVTSKNIPQSRSPPFINRPIFNMDWLSTAKREKSGAVSLKKYHNSTAKSSTKQRQDIFAFNTDTPSSIGGKDKTFSTTSTISRSVIHDSSVPLSTAKKGQPVAKEKWHVKKHLFSDTDTDNAMTEVSWLRESGRKPKPKVTKYSREASVKSKPVSTHISYESSDIPAFSQKPIKGNTKLNKKKPDLKERAEQPQKTVKPAAATNKPHAAGRRPQRAAATFTKSYKEPDTDDSQSESEPVSKYSNNDLEKTHEAAQVTKKTTAVKQTTKIGMRPDSNHPSCQSVSEHQPTSKKYFVGQQGKRKKTRTAVPEAKKRRNSDFELFTDIYKRLDSKNQSDLKMPSDLKQPRPENVLLETLKFSKRNGAPAREQMHPLKDSLAANQNSCSPCPPSIERMRSAERSAPTLDLTHSPLLTPRGAPLPASPDPPCKDTPSPILLLPKPRSTVSSKGNLKPSSFHSAEKKHGLSKTQFIQSVRPLLCLTPIGQIRIGPNAAEMSPIQQPSPPRSPLPLLTSTFQELDKPSMPSPPQSSFPEDTVNHGCHYGSSKVSSALLSLSSNKSSVLISTVKDSPSAVLAEKSPDLKPTQLLISGPSRKCRVSSSSNFEEDEKEDRKKSKMRGQHSPRMKPRKLFKSFAEVSAGSEVTSSSHTVSSSHWEAEVGDGDMDMDEDLELSKLALNPNNLCQQFSSELKKKFQNHYQMMEDYNKQSLKTVQQHVSSLNMQVSKYRTQRLEQVREVLLEEIHKLEQDDTVLKSMEKDMTMYWKKQSVAFRSYQEQEHRRNETLRKTLQSNICHNLEYEEGIFTSQMCLVRKDLKSVQERLLCQMQEGEMENVKRGLHALFFP